jgi:hypothetical protein
MDWKWSNGSIVERSPRISIKEDNPVSAQSMHMSKEILDNEAYLQSLNCDYDSEFRENNKREESYNKMAEREMIAQIGQNPFFVNNNQDNDEYVNNVTIQDKYLKPVSTIMVDKTKSAQQLEQ